MAAEIRRAVQIEKILFATDFSVYSDRAREYVRLLAKKLEASVTVFHAIEKIYFLEKEDDDFEIQEWYRDLEQDLREKLEREVAYFKQQGLRVKGKLTYGTPWESVVQYAQDRRIDLIVVGSHGTRTREGGVVLGTTSHKVVLTSPIPVLLVRADPPE